MQDMPSSARVTFFSWLLFLQTNVGNSLAGRAITLPCTEEPSLLDGAVLTERLSQGKRKQNQDPLSRGTNLPP